MLRMRLGVRYRRDSRLIMDRSLAMLDGRDRGWSLSQDRLRRLEQGDSNTVLSMEEGRAGGGDISWSLWLRDDWGRQERRVVGR